jgi:hypothetical protein
MLAQFRPLFTARTWKKMMILLTGAILARGRRTVTAALCQTGHQYDTNFGGGIDVVIDETLGLAFLLCAGNNSRGQRTGSGEKGNDTFPAPIILSLNPTWNISARSAK